jgi:hypothetical protein
MTNSCLGLNIYKPFTINDVISNSFAQGNYTMVVIIVVMIERLLAEVDV